MSTWPTSPHRNKTSNGHGTPAPSRHQQLQLLGAACRSRVDLLDFNAFLERYDQLNVAGKRLTDHETFDDWTLAVKVERCDEPAKILCCPEANGSCGAPA